MSVDLPQTDAAVYLTMYITHEYQLLVQYMCNSGWYKDNLHTHTHTHTHIGTHRRCPTAAAAPPSSGPSWALWGRSPLRWWRGSAGRTPGARSALWWTFYPLRGLRWPTLWAGVPAASFTAPRGHSEVSQRACMEADSWKKPSGSALFGHFYAHFGHFYTVKYALLTLKLILKRGDQNQLCEKIKMNK